MALIRCPECGKEISDQAEYCIHCGYPLHSMKRENRGQNGNTNTFSNNAPYNNDAYYEQVREKQNKSGVGFWGIVGAILLAMLILSFC